MNYPFVLKNLQVILSSNIHVAKGKSYDFLKPWLGNGLLAAPGKWINSRIALYKKDILYKETVIFISRLVKVKERYKNTQLAILLQYINALYILVEQWYRDRKLIMPTLHFTILEQYAVIMSEKTEIVIKWIEETLAENPTKAINIMPFVQSVTFNIICGKKTI